jgi:hypothetical protein
MKVLLTTLAIGSDYYAFYRFTFMKSQEDYAKRCGYDFHVSTHFPEATFMKEEVPQTRGTLTMHKILVCSQEWSEKYDMIIFIDADVLIHKNAPPLHDYMDYKEKIGIVDEFSQPTPEKRIALQRKNGWETSATEYHALCGLQLETPHALNTGLLVLQPKHHRVLLEQIFKKYIQHCNGHPRGDIFEQTVIGYELQKAECFTLLPNTFNTLWAIHKWSTPELNLEEFYHTTWFLHFAGKVDLEALPTLIQKWSEQ